MSHRRTTRCALGLAAIALLAGCVSPGSGTGEDPTPAGSPSPPAADRTVPANDTGPRAGSTPQTVVGGLDAPWSVAFTSHGTALVSQRDDGTILELTGAGTEGAGTREVGTVEGVAHGGEGGLLGLAVRTDDAGREWLYAYSTAAAGNRIQRFELTGDAGGLGLGTAQTLIEGLPAAGNHNGGRIAFGPDGMLYAGVGDAGHPASAQDLGSPAGKILRLTPDGEVPGDNPDPGSPVYSYGHRNVQGLAWDEDGTMFATEFGQNTWDELNVIEPGGNYGWPEVEGITGSGGTGAAGGFVDPVQQWSPSQASPSGMAALDGTLYIANLRGQVLRAVPVEDPGTSTTHWAGEYGRLRDTVVAPDGAVWVLTNNTDGRGRPSEGDDRILVFTPGP
ncbi:MAG: PQQ-dependent sugar dehydrogenase [Micrococcus sp.]|nr:PQQ-dependent sugar dehydrogenase [Micrococcus sp.]